MKRQFRIRFVLLSVGALVLLQTLIVGFSIARTYQQMTIKADQIIMLADTDPESVEAEDAHFFQVTYHLADRTLTSDLTHTKLVAQATAMEFAKKVISSKTDKGYLENYRYLVHRTKDTIQITFLSRSAALEFFQRNATTLIFVSLIGIVVMAGILTIVSSTVTAPLVKSHQKQKEFITSASHELKTPLTVIKADAQLLGSDIGESEWLLDILKQVDRMTDMTNSLVYLARMEEQNGQLVKKDFPISDLADDVVRSFQAVARNLDKGFNANIQSGITYHGDEQAIRELMTILLDNAFKHSTPDGNVCVELTAKGRNVHFIVENNVAGITQDQLERFSDRFYRLDTSDKVKGFGIGLSIARVVAEAHNGDLTEELPEDHLIKISAILK